MEYLHAVILGIVQGFTEFLPISSSAHLVIFPKILNWPYWGKTFDISLHFGTFLALLIYFWKKILIVVVAFFRSIKDRKIGDDPDKRLAWFMIISAIPGGLFGLLFEDFLEDKMSQLLPISIFIAVFAVVLWLADYYGKKMKELNEVTLKDAIIIAFLQGLALMPGVSRSGITMTGGLFLGFTRKTAAEFSFLISIPIIGGASIFKAVSLLKDGIPHDFILLIIIGLISAFLSGYFAIAFLIKFLQKGSFLWFVIYRLLLAIFLMTWYFTHL